MGPQGAENERFVGILRINGNVIEIHLEDSSDRHEMEGVLRAFFLVPEFKPKGEPAVDDRGLRRIRVKKARARERTTEREEMNLWLALIERARLLDGERVSPNMLWQMGLDAVEQALGFHRRTDLMLSYR